MFTSALSLIKDFKRLADDGRLGHAYLLFGESFAARQETGRGLLVALEKGFDRASGILTSSTDKQSQFLLTDGLVIGVKTGAELSSASVKLGSAGVGSVGIDEVRKAIVFLWQKPAASSRRAVFIERADRLTPEAENALLKIVEEPPPHGLVILSASQIEALPATLVSRCQKIFVAEPISLSVLEKEGLDKKTLGLARKFLASPGGAATRREIIKEILATESLEILRHFVAALMLECQQNPTAHFSLLRRLTAAWSRISQFNVNKKLQLETLLV